MQKRLCLLHIHTWCYTNMPRWLSANRPPLPWVLKALQWQRSLNWLCRLIWIRCGITTFLSTLFLLFHEPRSRVETYLSQDFCLGKGYWLHLKLLNGCLTMHHSCQDVYALVHVHLLKTIFYGNVLRSPTLFSPYKQIGLNIIYCLIKLYLAMKEPPFYLDMNSTSLFTVLSPPWTPGVLKDQSNQMPILGVFGVFLCFLLLFVGLFWLVGLFVCLGFFWKREVLCPSWLTTDSRKKCSWAWLYNQE